MKIFGPVLGAILAAAAIIAAIVWLRTGVVETERAEKALDKDIRSADAHLHMLKAAQGTTAAKATISRTPEPTRDSPSATAMPVRDPKVVTITQLISIAVQHGSVGVAAGTRLPFVSRAGDKVRVRYYDGADYDIPISATDLK
jgi:hypothetical protein